jgi:hypothetical protein
MNVSRPVAGALAASSSEHEGDLIFLVVRHSSWANKFAEERRKDETRSGFTCGSSKDKPTLID